MIYGNNILREIEAEYAERRRAANEKADHYKNILLGDPYFSAELKAYKTAKFEATKAEYLKDKSALDNALKEKTLHGKNIKKIQYVYGISSEMLKPDYRCKECGDTGKTEDGKRCRCFYKTAFEITLASLGIEKKDTAKFEDSKYPDKNNLGKIYEKLKAYCDKFGRGSKNIVFSGNVGTGKSRATECIVSELIGKGFNVVFLSAMELNAVLLKYHTAPIEEKGLYLEILTDCDLLAIDDLGTEPPLKNVTLEYLLLIISERELKDMPFIITTNLSPEQLLEKYGDRIFSRINDKKKGVHIKIDGDDLRLIK